MVKRMWNTLWPFTLAVGGLILLCAFVAYNRVLAEQHAKTAYHQGAVEAIQKMQEEAVANCAGRWVCDEGADQPRFEWVGCPEPEKVGGP